MNEKIIHTAKNDKKDFYKGLNTASLFHTKFKKIESL